VSDVIDDAQALELLERESGLAAVRARLPASEEPGPEDCDLCANEIEAERRAALPGVRTCVVCQEARERRRLLFREG
jgi:phage/conjugal plasmid C-4 type zinc finger TraR family protein